MYHLDHGDGVEFLVYIPVVASQLHVVLSRSEAINTEIPWLFLCAVRLQPLFCPRARAFRIVGLCSS